jgi:hypothetical protein
VAFCACGSLNPDVYWYQTGQYSTGAFPFNGYLRQYGQWDRIEVFRTLNLVQIKAQKKLG